MGSFLIPDRSCSWKIAYQKPTRWNFNLPWKPLESTLSRAELSTEWSAEKASHTDIIIHHHYHPLPRHRHHDHHHNYQRQQQQKHRHRHHYHLYCRHLNIFTIITIIIIITKPFSSSSSLFSSSLLQLFGRKTCWKRSGVYALLGGTPLLFFSQSTDTHHLKKGLNFDMF